MGYGSYSALPIGGAGGGDLSEYLRRDGTLSLTGNLAVAAGVTIDGRDLSADGAVLDGHVASTSNPHATSIANIGPGTVAQLNAALTDTAKLVQTNRTITAGTGLTGGGDLTANRTLAISYSGSIQPIGGLNLQGSSASPARADHVHAHDAQGGGSQHTVATTSNHGFMSYLDKIKLDGIATGAQSDHGGLTGLADDDHTQYLLTSGTRPMTGQLYINTPGSAGALALRIGGASSAIGFYEAFVGVLSYASGGVERWRFGGTQISGMTNGAGLLMGVLGGRLTLTGNLQSHTDGRAALVISNLNPVIHSSGTQRLIDATLPANVTGSAGYTVLDIGVDETVANAGSGSKLLLNARAGAGGTTQRAAITTQGQILGAPPHSPNIPQFAMLGAPTTGMSISAAGDEITLVSAGNSIVTFAVDAVIPQVETFINLGTDQTGWLNVYSEELTIQRPGPVRSTMRTIVGSMSVVDNGPSVVGLHVDLDNNAAHYVEVHCAAINAEGGASLAQRLFGVVRVSGGVSTLTVSVTDGVMDTVGEALALSEKWTALLAVTPGAVQVRLQKTTGVDEVRWSITLRTQRIHDTWV